MRSLQWHWWRTGLPRWILPHYWCHCPGRRDISIFVADVGPSSRQGFCFWTLAPNLHLYLGASRSGWGARLLDGLVSVVCSGHMLLFHIYVFELRAMFWHCPPFMEGSLVFLWPWCATTLRLWLPSTSGAGRCPAPSTCWLVAFWGGLSVSTSTSVRGIYQGSPLLWQFSSAVGISFRDSMVSPPTGGDRSAARLGLPVAGLVHDTHPPVLPLFCSIVPTPQAVFLNAFRIPWGNLRMYAFPPFLLSDGWWLESERPHSLHDSGCPPLAGEGVVCRPSSPWFSRFTSVVSRFSQSRQFRVLSQPFLSLYPAGLSSCGLSWNFVCWKFLGDCRTCGVVSPSVGCHSRPSGLDARSVHSFLVIGWAFSCPVTALPIDSCLGWAHRRTPRPFCFESLAPGFSVGCPSPSSWFLWRRCRIFSASRFEGFTVLAIPNANTIALGDC